MDIRAFHSKSLLLIGLGVIFAHVALGGPDPKPTVDFVLDLDDTLIRWIRPEESPEKTAVIPEAGEILGYRYRVLDGAPELIESLSRIPGARITFFSRANEERNLLVLKDLKLPGGKSARDIAYRVLSNPDMSDAERGSSAPRMTKDLKKVAGSDLSRVILIDDHREFVHPGQEKNHLWVGNKPAIFQEEEGTGPLSSTEFFRDRNKLARARGLVDRALFLSIARGIPLDQALWQIQSVRSKDGILRYDSRSFDDVELYERGSKLLNEVNPDFQIVGELNRFRFLSCILNALRGANPDSLP